MWQIRWLTDLRSAPAGNNNLELLEAAGKITWEDLDLDTPIHTRLEIANHMVKVHKCVAKYDFAYRAANAKQVCDAAIRTLLTKHMQHLAVDSRSLAIAAAAAAGNDTFSDMFRRLTENAILAELAGPALAGFKRSKKSARKLSKADVDSRRRLDPRRLPRLLVLKRPSPHLKLSIVFSCVQAAGRTSTSQCETSSSTRRRASPTRRGARAVETKPKPTAKRRTPGCRNDIIRFPSLSFESSPLV